MNNGIIYMDDNMSTSDAIFGKPLESTQQWIAQSVTNYTQQVGGMVAGLADSLMDRFQQFTSAANILRIEQMRNRLSGIWQTDGVRYLTDIHEIRQASPTMIRWTMAAPRLRASYNRDGCSAYDGQYKDLMPGGVGHSHYDYRRVMNGIVENGSYTNYYEQLLSQDDLLNIFEKKSIRATWDVINQLLDSSNSDPTDPWGNGTIV